MELSNVVCEMGDPERGDVTYIIDPVAPKVPAGGEGRREAGRERRRRAAAWVREVRGARL